MSATMHRIYMRAICPEKNIDRDWECIMTPDLFGQFLVQTQWGRYGGKAQRLTRMFETELEAKRYYQTLLRRRARARQRIGATYRIISAGF